jgi:succinate dehydrogenase / fumarate reductase cytochrome b subunit
MASSSHKRPLSPHVGIYRWQITNGLSILHRMTGFGLSFGALLLALWLWALAYDDALYAWLSGLFASWFGRIVLFGFTLAYFYHLGNGIRHLNWDMGRGFAIPSAEASGKLVLAFAVSLTVLTWTLIYRLQDFS